ncbi:MAG: prolipoprotein diacylglyceryl transferase [Sphingobacteriales bacterium]|nr:MAG: prolipoprotein diacylglyceryl transferase [Sphingobacteriales bacterium]
MLPNPLICGFEVSWYALCQYGGVAVMLLFGCWYYKHGIKERFLLWCTTLLFWYIGFLALFGARLVGMLEYFLVKGRFGSIDVLWQYPHYGHFSWCGALLFIVLFLPPIGKKLLGVSAFWQYFDFVAICLCMLTVITKQGCLLSGDGCYGVPTALPWGMHFAYGPVPSLLPVHPTPLYDSMFYFLLLLLLLHINKNKHFQGQTMLWYFMASAIFYILLEVIRINPKIWGDITLPQIIYLIVLGYCGYLYNLLKSKPSSLSV